MSADLDLQLSKEDRYINLENSISVKVAQVSGTDPESFVWCVAGGGWGGGGGPKH